MTEAIAPMDEVPPYEVLDVLYAALSDGHEHVEHVVTRDPDGGETRWAWVEVVGAVRAGERFVITGGNAQTETVLEPSVCPVCPAATLRYRSPPKS
jgi:hypothetical protein